MRFFYTFLFSFLYLNFYSQSTIIEGIVTDGGVHPLYLAQIFLDSNKLNSVASDIDGKFKIEVTSLKCTLHIQKTGYLPYSKIFTFKDGENRKIIVELKSASKRLSTVDIKSKRNEKKSLEEVSTQQIVLKIEQTNPSGNVEQALKFQGLGVGGNNELGSQYNVRGGNFDENLVYVNDFEIYRPMLMRSAQQEGLSFANASLIHNMKFSSGGFRSEYGDKLSSVLDIEYKKPNAFAASIEAGLMGVNAHMELGKKNEYSFIAGFRYRDNSYLLSSQETKGAYLPRFIDWQHLLTYHFSDKVHVDWLLNMNQNRFVLVPEDRQTNFGLANFALAYFVQYSGQERDLYNNLQNGIHVHYNPFKNLKLRYSHSAYFIEESQNFDITGQYRIGEIETDISSSNYQNLKSVIGAGIFQNWGRDQYRARIQQHQLFFNTLIGKNNIKGGLSRKAEHLQINISQWDRLDSGDYNIPISNQIVFPFVARSNSFLESHRYEFFIQNQMEFDLKENRKLGFNAGLRGNYWSLNNEFFLSPRLQVFLKPLKTDKLTLNMAVGSYNQSPFLRELFNQTAQLNTNVQSQKSLHYILGMDYMLKWYNRPFKLTVESYYKHMWDVNTYQYENVLIRYRANNQTIAYSKGIDFRLQGEIVKDAESWVNFSLMDTKEYTGDVTMKYFDSSGNFYLNPNANGVKITDSILFDRGFIPRQSQQFFTFNLFYQDYIPMMPNYKVHLNFIYASGLPFSPPNNELFRNSFTMKPYLRLDIGFSAMLYDRNKKNKGNITSKKGMESLTATLELFNFLDFQNQVSTSWVRDYNNNFLAVPNNLTGRRINARLILKF